MTWTRLLADVTSIRTFLLARAARSAAARGRLVKLRLRAVPSESILIRAGTSDAQVLWDVFVERYHRPPDRLEQQPRWIWDLGAYIGLTMIDLALLVPGASIVGVELDRENAALCRRNVAPWRDQCELVEAAVWPTDGAVRYSRFPGGEWASTVTETARSASALPESEAQTISLNTLWQTHRRPETIDYVKMDIEGAERLVLRQNTGWAPRVRCINVEVHDPYTVQDCVADLRALGFEAAGDEHPPPSVMGLRLDRDVEPKHA